MKNLDPFICELCCTHLQNVGNPKKTIFPVKRAFENNSLEGKLLTVRCAECRLIPYWLKEGNPSRSHLFNKDNVQLLRDFSRNYHYWSYGIGHLFELYIDDTDQESLDEYRNSPIELGFIVDEEVNLIVLTHRYISDDWRITPYQWHYHWEFSRDVPPITPNIEHDRLFTIALINEIGGKYLVIRNEILPLDFALEFHKAIHSQIERGIPEDFKLHQKRIGKILNLSIDQKIDPIIQTRTILITK